MKLSEARNLDAAVATALGMPVVWAEPPLASKRTPCLDGPFEGRMYHWTPLPFYSSGINEAFVIVRALRDRGAKWTFTSVLAEQWEVLLVHQLRGTVESVEILFADSLPEAIVRAAIAALTGGPSC